jgi:hypothetical protein
VAGTEIVEISLPDGALILARAERIDGSLDGPADVGLREFLSFSHVTGSIRKITAEMHKAAQALEPDVVEVELGFDLAVKGSQVLALIADAGTQASLRLRLEWRREPGGMPPPDAAESSVDRDSATAEATTGS